MPPDPYEASDAPAPETLSGLLRRAADFPQFGLRFVDRREKEIFLPWSDVHRRAMATAGRLLALGVARGERVALIYPTCPEFFDAFFGILLAGAVPTPLYPPVRLGRLEEYHLRTASMLRAAGARLVLTDRRVGRLLGETVARAALEVGALRLENLPVAPPQQVEAAADELALVQFSSGTTVAPKPAALTHRAILSQIHALNRQWPDQGKVWHSGVSWLPLYHDMGLIGCVFPALERPSILTLIGPEVFVSRPAIWLRAISRHQATISVAPNFAYGLCVERIRDEELEGVDLRCWRVALNGAEAVAPPVLRRFQERFAAWGFAPEALTPVYGLSEATLAVTFSDLEKPFTSVWADREALAGEGRFVPRQEGLELVSVGRPIAKTEIEIRDPGGQSLGEDRVGRIWARGPSLMQGYLGRPEATAETLVGGWLDTGDLGFQHRGELYLVGRAKDLVILRGRNFAPSEIEQALDSVVGLRKGCVVAVSHLPEGAEGEKLLILAERTREAPAGEATALPAACAEAVVAATGLRVDAVRVLEPGSLPRTSSGKLRRQEALRRHLAGELTPPKRVTPLYLAGALGRSALARLRPSDG